MPFFLGAVPSPIMEAPVAVAASPVQVPFLPVQVQALPLAWVDSGSRNRSGTDDTSASDPTTADPTWDDLQDYAPAASWWIDVQTGAGSPGDRQDAVPATPDRQPVAETAASRDSFEPVQAAMVVDSPVQAVEVCFAEMTDLLDR
jgi:hypothetical protein